MNDDHQHHRATPRVLPPACAIGTLVGAVLWDEASLVAGLAVVGLWAPAATVLGHAADKVGAAAFAEKGPSAARAAPK